MSETLIVQTNCGPVRGRRRLGTKNTIFYSFQRIPYAKPPIGVLRFKVFLWNSESFNSLKHSHRTF